MYKTIFLGDMGTGKTSFLISLVKGKFTPDTLPTVGVEIGMKTFTLGQDKKQYNVQFWDTAGQERFRSVCYQHYKNAHAALLFFDFSNKKSFESLDSWISDVKEYCEKADTLLCLFGNKVDKKQSSQIKKSQIDQFMAKYNIQFYEEISIMTGQNVQNALENLVSYIITKSPNQKKQRVIMKPQGKSCC